MEDLKFKEAVAGILKDNKQRQALAELLVEYIQPGHITKDFVSMLLNTRALKPGDALVKRVRKGITVHSHVPGSIPLLSQVTISDRINWVLDTADVGVIANEWDLQSGELGTVESLKAECMAKLRDYFMNKVFTALSTIWTAGNTPLNYATVAGTVTAVVLKAAIDRINQTTPGVKAVVGTRLALTPVTTFGASWSDGAATFGNYANIEAVMQNGWLGTYYGAPLIALQQEYDNPEDYNALLPNNKIVVIGQNVGEFITYGPERTKEWTDMEPTPPYWHMDIFQQFGMIIDYAQGIYVINIS